jgi:hypothetical protein
VQLAKTAKKASTALVVTLAQFLVQLVTSVLKALVILNRQSLNLSLAITTSPIRKLKWPARLVPSRRSQVNLNAQTANKVSGAEQLRLEIRRTMLSAPLVSIVPHMIKSLSLLPVLPTFTRLTCHTTE